MPSKTNDIVSLDEWLNMVMNRDKSVVMHDIAKDIVSAIKKGNGKATFNTVNGTEVSAMLDGDKVMLKDAAGNVATVTIADVNQSNGVIHVIDTVLLPGK